MRTQRGTDDAELLRGCALFSGLSAEQLTVLASKMRPVSFRRGAVIFLKDDQGDTLYVIRRGRVRISVANADGKALIINIYGPGEVFGEMSVFDGLPRSAVAVATEGVEALELSRADFTALLREMPELAPSIIALLSQRLRYTTDQTAILGLAGAYERVAFKLLQLAQENGGGPVTINLSQQDLASMLGLTREWLNKVLNIFVDQRVVELTRGRIRLIDPEALRRWI